MFSQYYVALFPLCLCLFPNNHYNPHILAAAEPTATGFGNSRYVEGLTLGNILRAVAAGRVTACVIIPSIRAPRRGIQIWLACPGLDSPGIPPTPSRLPNLTRRHADCILDHTASAGHDVNWKAGVENSGVFTVTFEGRSERETGGSGSMEGAGEHPMLRRHSTKVGLVMRPHNLRTHHSHLRQTTPGLTDTSPTANFP